MQHDFVLLDRSGSMADRWPEAINSVNEYVKKLAEDKVDTGVTLAVFDGNNGLKFDIVRDRITPPTWKLVDVNEVTPRGMTPLNDATGKIVDLANKGGYDKVAIIIMTDGHENDSKELSVAQAKALLDTCRAKNWQVIFLGADFNNAAQAASYGNAMNMTAMVSKSKLAGATRTTASMRAAYGATGQSMNYSDADKEDFAKPVKP